MSSSALPSAPLARLGPWWPGVAVLVLMCTVLLASGITVDNVRAAIRATARLSLVCFCLAYAASALWQVRPTPLSAWLRRHRRQWGLLFVASHTVHLVFIGMLRLLDPALFASLVPAATLVSGTLAYAVLWAMGLSSNDRVAARMGAPAWRRLHTWGSHYLWLSFAVAYGKRVPLDAVYALPFALLLVVLGLRLGCALRRPSSSVPSRP